MNWQTSRRTISIDRPLVMGILNVTPDSFSDGGQFAAVGPALRHAAQMIDEGADIIDVGGESTRPGAKQVSSDEEIARVIPVITAINSEFNIPVSIDTTKSKVAKTALDAGAEIINDISGLRWDAGIAGVAAASEAGLILMHSRGEFDTMHSQPAVDDIVRKVSDGLRSALAVAADAGVAPAQIALDIGIGFGKTQDQNLELLAKLDKIVVDFDIYPVMIGTSRKSFLGRILGGVPPDARLAGNLATAVLAACRGAKILRVHDVRATVQALSVAIAVEERCSQ